MDKTCANPDSLNSVTTFGISKMHEICDIALHFLIQIYSENQQSVRKQTDDMLATINKDLRKRFIARQRRLYRWQYFITLVCNFFAIHRWGADHECLDFSTPESKVQKDLADLEPATLTDDSVNMITLRLFDGMLDAFRQLEAQIPQNDDLAHAFYQECLYPVIHNNASFHEVFFPFCDQAGLAQSLSRKDRSHIFFKDNPHGYSKNNIIENTLKELLLNK